MHKTAKNFAIFGCFCDKSLMWLVRDPYGIVCTFHMLEPKTVAEAMNVREV